MIRTLKKLLPRGLAWLLPVGYMRALVAGVAMEYDRIAAFLEGVVLEANPGTAEDCLEEWFEQYGLPWTSTGSVEGKQEDALSRYISLGGQDIVYFQRMIVEAGFGDIIISENPLTTSPDVFEFFVDGSVNVDADFNRLATLVQRLSPAHCFPTYGVSIAGNVWGDNEPVNHGGLYGVAVCSGR